QNFVVNSGFENTPLNMGFDWRYQPNPSVTLALDAQQFHGGDRSFSIAFDGGAVINAGISQFIPLESNASYSFSAFVKTDNIFAANGPQFLIHDAYDKKPLLVTEDILGATDWRQISGSF